MAANPAPADATPAPAAPADAAPAAAAPAGSHESSGSYHINTWGPAEEEQLSRTMADMYHRERDEAWRELGEVSKQYDIDQAEWEAQQKQFCDAISGWLSFFLRLHESRFLWSATDLSFVSALSAELDRVKAAAISVADKVNARGETVEERLAAVEGRVDEAAIHGVHLGASLGLAAMSDQAQEDFTIHPVGFRGGRRPDEVDGIEDLLDEYHDHATAIAEATHPQSILNKLFHE